jgi:hypothetical protein
MRRSRTSRTRRPGLAALVIGLIALLLPAGTAAPAHAVTGTAETSADYGFTARLDIGNGQRACSGALIYTEWLLTAASCFDDDPAAGLDVPAGPPPLATTATLGRADLTTGTGEVRDIVEIIPHPDQDLVLARLSAPVTSITPVTLSDTAPVSGEELRVAGYGRTTDEWAPLSLHTGTFAVETVSDTEIAITGQDGAAVCAGDAGGPALRETGTTVELVAVNSRSWQGGCFGTDEAVTDTGAVETRLDTLRAWIGSQARVSCVRTGAVYSVTSAGGLLRRSVQNPADPTEVPSARTIDTGWNRYQRVLASNQTNFYGINDQGLFVSHRDFSAGVWDVHHRPISGAYANYRLPERRHKITVDREGHIWRIDPNGDLRWAQYDVATDTWAPLSDLKIDAGWDRYDLIVATDNGVLFGRDAVTGHLLRSRYDFASQRWIDRHVTASRADWHDARDITSFGGDSILVVRPNGELRYYRFSEAEGNFAIYNRRIGSGAHWAGYTSVTGAPVSCMLTTVHTPVSPAIATEPHSPASLLQTSTGALEYAYTDGTGRLLHGRQADPDDFGGLSWAPVPSDETFTGQPQLDEQPDGRVGVLTWSVDGDAWWRRHTAGTTDWGTWRDLAGAMHAHPTTVKTPEGVLVQFSVDGDGRPWYRVQQRPNVDYMGWMPLTGAGLSGPLTAVGVTDGIQLFGRDAEGRLRTATFVDGTLTAWTAVGDAPVTGRPSVVVHPDGRLGVFARDTEGAVVALTGNSDGTFPAPWTRVGDFTPAGPPSAVVHPVTGATEIVARGTDGVIHHTGEEVPGSGTWRPWTPVTAEASAVDPTAFTYESGAGPAWGFVFRTDTDRSHVYAARDGAFTGHVLPAPPMR